MDDSARTDASSPTWQFTIGSNLTSNTLSGDMYEGPGACLKELLNNAACACQTSEDEWRPDLVHVEFSLVKDHPLARGCLSLVCRDKGHGFRNEDIARFCVIGGHRKDRRRNRHAGVAQKQVGRFSYLMLNREVRQKKNRDEVIKTGFFILTRTASTGAVTLVTVLPDNVDKPLPVETIKADDARLGAYRGITGSFTIVVIPNSVYETADDLRRDLRWELPRLREKSMDVQVEGKKLAPPTLPKESISVMHDGHPIKAYMEVGETEDDEEGGLWLTDAETGMRCALCASTMARHVPWPLQRRRLRGDIFVRGLKASQSTDRAGLNQDFLRETWPGIQSTLGMHVAPFALKVLGESDMLDPGNPTHRAINDVIADMENLFGPVDVSRPPPPPPTGPRGPRNPTGEDGGKPRPERHRLGKPIRIGNRVFQVVPDDHPDTDMFARVAGDTLLLNTQYTNYPGPALGINARREHGRACLFEAVAAYDNPADIDGMRKAIGELRREAKQREGKKAV